MLQAYGALFAWKLGLHGVNPASMSQQVGKKTFPAINGHRDAGSTACPGRYLYAKLANIRAYAVAGGTPAPPPPPAAPHGRDRRPRPAVQPRGRGVPRHRRPPRQRRPRLHRAHRRPDVLRKATTVSTKGWTDKQDVLVTPDVTGDGVIDLVSTSKKGVLRIRPGKGNGKFKATSKVVKATRGPHPDDRRRRHRQGRPQRPGRPAQGPAWSPCSAPPKGGFKRVVLGKGMGSYVQFIGVGDQNGDGNVDLLARNGKGASSSSRARATAASVPGRAVPGLVVGVYNRITSGADFNGDGRARPGRAAQPRARSSSSSSAGDGTFWLPIGPATNVRSLRSHDRAGNLVGDAAPDLVGVKGNSLVVVAQPGHLRPRCADRHRRLLRRRRPASSTSATGTATAPAT